MLVERSEITHKQEKEEKMGPQLPDLHEARRGGLYRRYEIVIYAQSELKRKDKRVKLQGVCTAGDKPRGVVTTGGDVLQSSLNARRWAQGCRGERQCDEAR